MSLLWVDLCSPKRYVEVLTPLIYEYDLICKQGLCRYNQLKMKSYLISVGLKSNDWCSNEEKET